MGWTSLLLAFLLQYTLANQAGLQNYRLEDHLIN
jgi:hypothetical protein